MLPRHGLQCLPPQWPASPAPALPLQLVLPDGGVLRARLPGRPTRDCLFLDVLRDRSSLLKVWNGNAVTTVVGVFNLQARMRVK